MSATKADALGVLKFIQHVLEAGPNATMHDRAKAAAMCADIRFFVKKDKADAERYRWLRDVGDATWRPFGIRDGYSAAQADVAIDAARELGGSKA